MENIASLRRQSAIDDVLRDGWVKHLDWRHEVDSTNNLAKQWYAEQADRTPALFIADFQTAGRGRGGNQWWSPSGCLMLTLIIPATELPADVSLHPQLALVAGVAIARAADKVIAQALETVSQLKWPNDVYIGGRKVAGILIEAVQQREAATGFAIGIGMNACVPWQDAPAQLLERATCLSTVAGRTIEVEEVMIELIASLSQQLSSWRADSGGWSDEWRSRCLLSGRIVHVKSAECGEVVGLCEGIDAQGRLQLRSETQLHILNACEILSWT